MALDSAIMIIEFKNTVGEDLIKPIAMLLILLYLKKWMKKCFQVKYPEKDFPSFPTGVKPLTFQNTGWNAVTTEL